MRSFIRSNECILQSLFIDPATGTSTDTDTDGVDDLLDAISLQAEVMELSASVTTPAKGTVIESRLDKGRGVIVTVLVLKGNLKIL